MQITRPATLALPIPVLLARVLAVFGIAALLLQLYVNINRSGLVSGVWAFVWYFTILTNLYATLNFVARAMPGNDGRLWRFMRSPQNLTTVTACIIVVWSVYHFVLRAVRGAFDSAYVADVMLHDVMPFATLAYWWLAVPRGALTFAGRAWRHLLWYPAFYLVYVFARGAVEQRYPYFFIDVTTLGYPGALAGAAAVLLLLIVLMLALWGINRVAGRRTPAAR
jgi:hypothetical protein